MSENYMGSEECCTRSFKEAFFMKRVKKFHLLIFIIISTSVLGEVKEQEYKMKSGYIKYEISGYDNGFSKVYFDNYGKNESIYSEKVFQVNKTEMKTILGTIKKAGKLYTLNYMSQTYFIENIADETGNVEKKELENIKTKNSMERKIEEAFEELEDEMKELDSKTVEKSKVLGTEVVLGKKCEILKTEDGVVWMYKGIVFRKIRFLNQEKIIYEAVEFKENPKISKEQFEIPVGFMIVENPMNNLYKSNN